MTIKIVKRSVEGPSKFDHSFAAIQNRVRKAPYNQGNYPEQVWLGMLQLPKPPKKEFFIAVEGDNFLGRIGVNIPPDYPGKGYVGFFEVDVTHNDHEKIAKELLTEAESWLKEQGAEEIIGPINYNTWFSYRFRVDQSDDRFFIWEPINPPEYVTYFKNFGFETNESYSSTLSDKNYKFADATKKYYERCIDNKFTFHAFESEEFLHQNLESIFKLSLEGFSKNYLYEAITFPEFQALYVPLFKKFDFSTSHMAKSPDGEAAAFSFTFRSGNDSVFKSIVVSPNFQGKGLSNALIHCCAKKAHEQGLVDYISALFKRDSITANNLQAKTETLWEHEYHLFSKKLD
ncbi:MAG: GNAT family N-acetyltransferase [Bdellovibrionota bacterium]|nr:GNAT family N-acetyltransferase [Bdellovibrionota bacterium]